MAKRVVQVYYGKGTGKTSAAVGQCIKAASQGLKVIMIQFMKGNDFEEYSYLSNFEPNIKLFSFEKATAGFLELPPDRQKEERQNIINGFNFARKVVDTGECDVLVLDEVLGLIDIGILSVEDIIKLIELRDDYARLVMTGVSLPEELLRYTNVVSRVELVKDTKGEATII